MINTKLTTFLPIIFTLAQDIDFMRSTGKIYTVIAGILVIFIGIVIYLRRIDNKITHLEIQIKDEHKTS